MSQTVLAETSGWISVAVSTAPKSSLGTLRMADMTLRDRTDGHSRLDPVSCRCLAQLMKEGDNLQTRPSDSDLLGNPSSRSPAALFIRLHLMKVRAAVFRLSPSWSNKSESKPRRQRRQEASQVFISNTAGRVYIFTTV